MDVTEHLRIETPEQVALELPIAGVGSRFLALSIDTVVQFAAAGLTLLALILMGSMNGLFAAIRDLTQTLGPALFTLVLFALYWGYYAFFEWVWDGQTPGKRVASIRVVKESGRPADGMAVVLRNLLRAVDILPFGYAVGIICMMFNRQSRRLGDIVAGTVVVHDRREKERGLEWVVPVPGQAAGATAPVSAVKLSGDELTLIETFLERRLDLDVEVAERMAMQIITRLGPRTGLHLPAGQMPSEFLEATARQARQAPRTNPSTH